MQATDDPPPDRRIVLSVVTSLWLAGHWFFPEGYTHLKVFWCLIPPLVLLNALPLSRPRRPDAWFSLLLALLLWQVLVSSRHPGSWCQPGGSADALAVLLFVIALRMMAATRGAWTGLRWTLFATAVATMAWSLLKFYPLSGVTLPELRFRDVLVYADGIPPGLNPVLTGLLASFAMLTGMTLATSDCSRSQRTALWTGIAILAFAMIAAQSRGALLAAATGGTVLLWRERRRAIPAMTAAAVGILAYLAVFFFGSGGAGPDLVSRGSSGRLAIWEIHLGRLEGSDWWLGKGQAEALPEGVLGWFVHHPHSSFVTQLVHTGIPGLLLLGALLAWTLRIAARQKGRDTAALVLLVSSLAGLLNDGAQIVSLFSIPRIESLLVLVPAVFATAPPPDHEPCESLEGPP